MTKRTKRCAQPVQLPRAHLSGRKYEEDRPDDCRFCYFWRKTSKDCQLKGHFFHKVEVNEIIPLTFAGHADVLSEDPLFED